MIFKTEDGAPAGILNNRGRSAGKGWKGGRAPGVAESGEIFRASGREGESDSPGNWKIEPAPPPAPSRESLSEGSRGDIPFTRLPLRFGDTHGRASLCIDGDDNSDKNQWIIDIVSG